ncbi:MAG: flagellar hook-associated protein FlgK [Balneolaceae bacterium]
MRTLFEISRSGLRHMQRSLSVTSNNVINAETPGYSRQRAISSPAGNQLTGYHIGLGVNATEVQRLRDELNDQILSDKQHSMGFMEQKMSHLQRLEAAMTSDSGSDLDVRLSKFFDSFSDLSSSPQDMSMRNAVASEAVQLTHKLHEMSRSNDRTGELAQDSARSNIEEINGLLRDIHTLNESIRRGEAKGQGDYSSLDLRVAKMEELSRLVGFESQVSGLDSMEIRINGILVVDETSWHELKPEFRTGSEEMHVRLANGKNVHVTEGALGADLEMINDQIPNFRIELDQLAETVVQEVNQVHISGYGLEDDQQRHFFDPTRTTASGIQVRDEILQNHEHIAASTESETAGNGELAIEMASLRDKALFGHRKIGDQAVQMIAGPGREIHQLEAQMESRESEIQMLKNQQEQVAGVNLDEELAMLIQYQNAYQGAARMMTAAQDTYDTLIAMLR